MLNKKEYFITKLSFTENKKLIKDIFVYEFDSRTLASGSIQTRAWMMETVNKGLPISSLLKNEKGDWIRGKLFTTKNGVFSWEGILPENLIKRKTFISYYHRDDQSYRNRFESLFSDLVVSKSVDDGDIDSGNCDSYIKQLIHKDYLSDVTVLAVLVGPKTKCRKHVDWEIAGALNKKVGDNYACLIGILLPTHPDYGTGKYKSENLPQRLAANVKTGYAVLINWTTDRVKLQKSIELAFARRAHTDKIVNKFLLQMSENTCD